MCIDLVVLLVHYFLLWSLLIILCLLIKQYDSTVQVGIGAIIVPVAKNAASKTILKMFYATKIHLYGIVLVHHQHFP